MNRLRIALAVAVLALAYTVTPAGAAAKWTCNWLVPPSVPSNTISATGLPIDAPLAITNGSVPTSYPYATSDGNLTVSGFSAPFQAYIFAQGSGPSVVHFMPKGSYHIVAYCIPPASK